MNEIGPKFSTINKQPPSIELGGGWQRSPTAVLCVERRAILASVGPGSRRRVGRPSVRPAGVIN